VLANSQKDGYTCESAQWSEGRVLSRTTTRSSTKRLTRMQGGDPGSVGPLARPWEVRKWLVRSETVGDWWKVRGPALSISTISMQASEARRIGDSWLACPEQALARRRVTRSKRHDQSGECSGPWVATRLGRWPGVSTICKMFRNVSNPFCFFGREERESKNQKQNTVTFQSGAPWSKLARHPARPSRSDKRNTFRLVLTSATNRPNRLTVRYVGRTP